MADAFILLALAVACHLTEILVQLKCHVFTT